MVRVLNSQRTVHLPKSLGKFYYSHYNAWNRAFFSSSDLQAHLDELLRKGDVDYVSSLSESLLLDSHLIVSIGSLESQVSVHQSQR